jgi:hypothetical protein
VKFGGGVLEMWGTMRLLPGTENNLFIVGSMYSRSRATRILHHWICGSKLDEVSRLCRLPVSLARIACPQSLVGSVSKN